MTVPYLREACRMRHLDDTGVKKVLQKRLEEHTHNWRHLSSLARDILGTGSTAALERCFSNTGRVWTERRTRLDPRVGSDILLCHENINRGNFGDCNGHLCLLDFPRGLSGAASTLVACLLPAKGEHACWAPKRASRASFGQNLHQRPASSLPERVPH